MVEDTLQRYHEVTASWRPGRREAHDVVRPETARRFAALLDAEPPDTQTGRPLPPLWHWFLFPETLRHSELGPDGHPRDGTYMPPIGPRRRMFGGGRLRVHEPLRFGDRVTRVTDVTSVKARSGSSGPLLLVTLRHALRVRNTERLVEEQDIVYRPPQAPAGQDAPTEPMPAIALAGSASNPPAHHGPWELTVRPDPVLLFRFSALTSNAHRIHYDAPYARQVEGHPGLVVHGPLLALLLLELARRHAPERTVSQFSWRARSPLYAGQLIRIHGQLEHDDVVLAAGADSHLDCVSGTASLGGAA